MYPVALLLVAFLHPTASAQAHDERIDIVVEAVLRTGNDLGRVDYGVALTFSDGDPVTGANVEVSAAGSTTIPAVETIPGIYIAEVHLPLGETPVTISFDQGSVQFTQLITQLDAPVSIVEVDTKDPSRVGRRSSDGSAILAPVPDPVSKTADDGRVVVEACVVDEFDPLAVTYTIALEPTNPVSAVLRSPSSRCDGAQAEASDSPSPQWGQLRSPPPP